MGSDEQDLGRKTRGGGYPRAAMDKVLPHQTLTRVQKILIFIVFLTKILFLKGFHKKILLFKGFHLKIQIFECFSSKNTDKGFSSKNIDFQWFFI